MANSLAEFSQELDLAYLRSDEVAQLLRLADSKGLLSVILEDAGIRPQTEHGFVIVPSDEVTFATTRALFVGKAGDLAVRISGGSSLPSIFRSVPVGTLLPIPVDRVFATGTTASGIVGFRETTAASMGEL